MSDVRPKVQDANVKPYVSPRRSMENMATARAAHTKLIALQGGWDVSVPSADNFFRFNVRIGHGLPQWLEHYGMKVRQVGYTEIMTYEGSIPVEVWEGEGFLRKSVVDAAIAELEEKRRHG